MSNHLPWMSAPYRGWLKVTFFQYFLSSSSRLLYLGGLYLQLQTLVTATAVTTEGSLVAVGHSSILPVGECLLLDVVELVDALLARHKLTHWSTDHCATNVLIATPWTPLLGRDNLGEVRQLSALPTTHGRRRKTYRLQCTCTLATPHLCAPWSSM